MRSTINKILIKNTSRTKKPSVYIHVYEIGRSYIRLNRVHGRAGRNANLIPCLLYRVLGYRVVLHRDERSEAVKSGPDGQTRTHTRVCEMEQFGSSDPVRRIENINKISRVRRTYIAGRW